MEKKLDEYLSALKNGVEHEATRDFLLSLIKPFLLLIGCASEYIRKIACCFQFKKAPH